MSAFYLCCACGHVVSLHKHQENGHIGSCFLTLLWEFVLSVYVCVSGGQYELCGSVVGDGEGTV